MQAITPRPDSYHPVHVAIESLFRRKYLFLILAVATVLIIGVVTLVTPRQYRSEMKFLLENERTNQVITSDKNSIAAATEITEQQINSELELMGSEDVLSAVADPRWAALPLAQRTDAAIKEHERKVASLQKHLQLGATHRSNIIYVSFNGSSPENAAETLQRLSAAYFAH